MHYRHEKPDRGGEGVGVVPGPALGQKGPKLGATARSFLEQRPPGSEERIEIDPGHIPGKRGAGKGSFQDRLHHRAQCQAVARGD